MDVACNDEGWIELNQVWLSNEYLLGFFDKHLDLLLRQIDWLDSEVGRVGSDVVAHLKEGVNDVVQLVVVHATSVTDGTLGIVASWCTRLASILKSVCAHFIISFQI